MRASATSLLTVLALATGGCASTINALTNRPVTSDVLDEWKNGRAQELNKLKTVSGDRRLVRVQAYNPTSANWTICAETQADAIAARGAQSGLSIDSRGKVDDKSVETLLLTNSRSEVSDVVRQLAWQICNAHLNGAYLHEQGGYAKRLDRLQDDAMKVLLARTSAKAENAPETGNSVTPNLEGDKKKEE